LARAGGVGVDFIDLGDAPAGEVVLRLVKDLPIRGRVIDTEGKPVPGVTVSVQHLAVYGDNSLDPLLAMWKKMGPESGLPAGGKPSRRRPPARTGASPSPAPGSSGWCRSASAGAASPSRKPSWSPGPGSTLGRTTRPAPTARPGWTSARG